MDEVVVIAVHVNRNVDVIVVSKSSPCGCE
jgi:hypothetical protein